MMGRTLSRDSPTRKDRLLGTERRAHGLDTLSPDHRILTVVSSEPFRGHPRVPPVGTSGCTSSCIYH